MYRVAQIGRPEIVIGLAEDVVLAWPHAWRNGSFTATKTASTVLQPRDIRNVVQDRLLLPLDLPDGLLVTPAIRDIHGRHHEAAVIRPIVHGFTRRKQSNIWPSRRRHRVSVHPGPDLPSGP